ncbi:MAG: CCA tRNA nucleotidyltransferase [Candidatus Heimdallarchaeota archaeon]|nr:MAG: CCA tRNA nucleotidyltransferase [Candidatus Heimdallarchaeota archaeon]
MSKNPEPMRKLSDYTSILSNSIPTELRLVFEILWAQHKEVYIVGGAIRDCLLGSPTIDFDIITDARPEEVEKFLNAKGIKTRPIGGEFGTILAIVDKNAVFDISTFRREIYSSSGPPEIVFVDSLEEDLPRRDFSFNAIAYDPRNRRFIDKHDGFRDLKQGIIQTIGDAYTRISEDGTRIIRLARFVSQFELKIHPNLLAATLSIGKKARFFSYTMLQKEFFKLLLLPDPTKGLRLLWDAKVLSALFPNFPLSKSNVDSVKSEKILKKFSKIPSRDVWVKLFGLLLFLSDNIEYSEENWLSVCLDLKITDREQKKLLHIFRSWLNFPQFPEFKKLKQWIRATGINTSENLVELIFLKAELEELSDILIKKEQYIKEVQIILESFRRSSSDNKKKD